MSIRVALEHRTRYRFDRMVTIAPHELRLRPAPHCRTPVSAYSLRVEPDSHFLNWQQDPFANHVARVVFPERADELEIVVDLVADLTVINPFDFFLDESAERWPFRYDAALAVDLAPYLATSAPGPLLREWLAEVDREPAPTANVLVGLNQRLRGDIAYTLRMEPGVQAPEDTLAKALGSCRDTGWLLVEILRQLGLAARFVSGYLVQLAPDERPLDGPPGPAADFTDLHAWAEVYVPGAGWVGLDPTSGLLAGEGHIPLACAPSPAGAAPVVGAIGVCEVTLEYANTVTRIHEDPRVTRPYSDEQWAAIDAVGHDVDRRLVAADVRLTMGGEPTFVSVDDMESPEWTIAADGPEKRRLAQELAVRLGDRFAPGALFQHGQGKWYPGEPLPRWQLELVWRDDGVPVWRDPALLADPSAPGAADGHDGRRFAAALTAALGLP
ncbi:MAG: dehydrogenase, partial [Actinomycetia bacterium]|nr:dehydrogenase [Actinomycetes bacterium]